MRRDWICSTRVGGCIALAAVWGMLVFPEIAFAGSCGNGKCQKNETAESCSADCGGGGGGGDEGSFKDIPVSIVLDGVQTIGGTPTLNAVYTDGGGIAGEYENSKKKKIQASVGRNRHVVLRLNKGTSRTLNVDMPPGETCCASTRVDVDPANGVCDVETTCDDGLIPAPPDLDLSIVNLLFNTGEDLDDLPETCEHHDNAIMGFTATSTVGGEENWVLRWGPYDGAGGAGQCPNSGPVVVTRTGDNTWSFTTTGDHLACLYRQQNPPHGATEYHGQFFMPFSGVATAIENQVAPDAPVLGCPEQHERDRRNRELSPSADGAPMCGLIDCSS